MRLPPAYLAAGAVALSLFVFARLFSAEPNKTASSTQLRQRTSNSCGRAFVSYTPSRLENDWASKIRRLQDGDPQWKRGCTASVADREAFLKWMAAIEASRGKTVLDKDMDEGIFSKLTWRNPCTGALSHTYIEPLADVLRSPFFWCFGASTRFDFPREGGPPHDSTTGCALEPGGCAKYNLMSTDYLLLSPGEEVEAARPGGKKFFFDLGCTTYNRGSGGEGDSMKWFMDTYKARGVVFDHVFAWEMLPANHRLYWNSVPDDMTFKLVFYNVPAVSEVGHKQSPITHILKRTRPEDYVVLKVDIDDSDLEKEFINQVIEMPDVAARVDELFWEHHVLSHPLSNTPGRTWTLGGKMRNATDTLADSYRIFQELRRLGIKAHSWV